MESETTAQELRTQLLHGWFVSCLLHGLMLVSLLTFFHLSPTSALKEPFHWDVALVHSSQTGNRLLQPVEASKPTLPNLPRQSAVLARTIRHAAAVPKQTIPNEPKTTESAAPLVQPNIASSASLPYEPMPSQLAALDSPLHQPEIPIGSTTAEPSIPQTTAATSHDDTLRKIETTQLVQLPSGPSVTEAASTSRPDYGWLQQAIFKRLEELKRAARPSLDQPHPIKVMVKAVVSREGILLDSTIAKSSGFDRIDQEAMALVQRAFPMQFDRTLEQEHIVMRIPITYSQE